jgi:biopolymer transport protein ExbD
MQLARRPRRAGFMGLTPLIDMIFLLLLFFLLGSDFVTYGQSRLAPPRSTGGATSAAPPVVITLGANGALNWNGAPIDTAFLRRETAKLTAQNDEQIMVLMPAGAANVQQVTDIMDALQGAGAQSITLERDVFDIYLADF